MGLEITEQTNRRKAVEDAVTNARLEGLEPDPIFFEYAERYIRGEISLAEVLADYKARLAAVAQSMQAR